MEKVLEKEDNRLWFRRIDALRLYGGDIRERCSDGSIGRESADPLYGDKEAYRTLNALLFKGIKNEQERICKESYILNLEFIRRIDETVQIYTDIFTIMKEKFDDFDSNMVGKRVERASSMAYYKNGFTQSFLSCSKGSYDEEFSKKSGIVLLEIEIAPNVPFVDYEKVLKKEEYKNLEEREILLPPFLNIEMTKIDIVASETRRIKDLYGKPPIGKYRIKTLGMADYRRSILESEEMLWQQIVAGKECAACLLENMNRKDENQDYTRYIEWKENLHKYLKIQLSKIWYGGDLY